MVDEQKLRQLATRVSQLANLEANELAQVMDDASAAILSLLDELQTLREERTAWRVTAENAEAAVKQARIDALEEAAAICKANAAMCSEGVMRLTLEANAAAIESLKETP